MPCRTFSGSLLKGVMCTCTYEYAYVQCPTDAKCFPAASFHWVMSSLSLYNDYAAVLRSSTVTPVTLVQPDLSSHDIVIADNEALHEGAMTHILHAALIDRIVSSQGEGATAAAERIWIIVLTATQPSTTTPHTGATALQHIQ